MRQRAPVVLLVVVLACLLGPPAASAAEDYLRPYTTTADQGDVAELAKLGVDVEHAGWDGSGPAEQELAVALFAAQARTLEARGVDLEPLAQPTASRKSAAAGDSPNPYYNVYRQFMGEGGIHDEMLQIAKDNKDIVKYERIGTSMLGKPMAVLKMTANARNTKDGTRPAVLFSSNNHAREWIAAEVQRRLMGWFAANKDEPGVRRLLETREIWFMPIQNPDGYDYTFTCGTGDANHLCPASETPTNRFWRKTLRDNNNDGIFGNPGDGVDPNRNYPAKRGIDEEGASNNIGGETYRGPYALSEPENLAFDRLLRKIPFKANVNYHSAGQLLLTPVSYITDYAPNDATIFNAMTGVDGDGAVEPYQPQRSSDLYESNGDTIDNAYLNYGVIGWTPELDTCATGGGPNGCNQFAFPDDEDKVQAIFEKNLPMALNIVHSADHLDRPKNYENDPGRYQVKPTQDIQINEFDVSYGATQTIEAITRKSLGPVDVNATISGPGGANRTVVLRATDAPAGERYGDAAGVYFHRVRVTTPENWATPTQTARPAVAGDTVSLSVRAGGLRQRMSYRIQDVGDSDPATKRVLVVAAEDYTGRSPNRSGAYDSAPRYLGAHASALQALGYDVSTFDIDAPPQNASGAPGMKQPTALGVLSHFDAVVFESGDDFIPQDASETNPRHLSTPTSQSGSYTLAPWAHKTMIALRDYLNEGGKLVVGGRNAHQWPIGSTSLSATGPYQWTPDKVFGFFYPDNNAGDDDLPGTAFQRSRGISNDTWQNYLGVVGRATAGGSASSGYGNSALDAEAMTAKAGGIFDGMAPFTLDTAAGNDPNQDAGGAPAPRAKSPTRLRNWSSISVQEPLRQERVELDVTTPQTQVGGTALSTADTVTFGFGLEQVGGTVREELLDRALGHLLPTAADTTAPQVAFKAPASGSGQMFTPRDPVEVDVTAADERGDMKEVRLLADGEQVGRAGTFPFQFRWVPTASDAGKTVTLTAEAEDAAGNVSTTTKAIDVAAAAAESEAPLPAGNPTLQGSPTVGSTLTCVNGGFLNAPSSYSYEWLADGSPIAGAAGEQYTLGQGELGRLVACRITAVNDAGDADATSESRYVSAASAGPPGPPGTPGTPGNPGTPGTPGTPGPRETLVALECEKRKAKQIECVVRQVLRSASDARLRVTGRISGRSKQLTRSGARRVRLRLNQPRKVRGSQKVVLRVRKGTGKLQRVTLKLDRSRVLALANPR
jgi:hypothetical protein